MQNSFEYTESGTCAACQKAADKLIAFRVRMSLTPGLCRHCSPIWPSGISRNDELLRWHAQPSWDDARDLKLELEEAGRPGMIWLECKDLAHLDRMIADRKTGDLDASRPIFAFVHEVAGSDGDLTQFTNIQWFLNKSLGTSCELHIVERGPDFVDDRPFYNLAAA